MAAAMGDVRSLRYGGALAEVPEWELAGADTSTLLECGGARRGAPLSGLAVDAAEMGTKEERKSEKRAAVAVPRPTRDTACVHRPWRGRGGRGRRRARDEAEASNGRGSPTSTRRRTGGETAAAAHVVVATSRGEAAHPENVREKRALASASRRPTRGRHSCGGVQTCVPLPPLPPPSFPSQVREGRRGAFNTSSLRHGPRDIEWRRTRKGGGKRRTWGRVEVAAARTAHRRRGGGGQ